MKAGLFPNSITKVWSALEATADPATRQAALAFLCDRYGDGIRHLIDSVTSRMPSLRGKGDELFQKFLFRYITGKRSLLPKSEHRENYAAYWRKHPAEPGQQEKADAARRTFSADLCTHLNRFLIDEWRIATREAKRFSSMDSTEIEERYPSDDPTPDAALELEDLPHVIGGPMPLQDEVDLMLRDADLKAALDKYRNTLAFRNYSDEVWEHWVSVMKMASPVPEIYEALRRECALKSIQVVEDKAIRLRKSIREFRRVRIQDRLANPTQAVIQMEENHNAELVRKYRAGELDASKLNWWKE